MKKTIMVVSMCLVMTLCVTVVPTVSNVLNPPVKVSALTGVDDILFFIGILMSLGIIVEFSAQDILPPDMYADFTSKGGTGIFGGYTLKDYLTDIQAEAPSRLEALKSNLTSLINNVAIAGTDVNNAIGGAVGTIGSGIASMFNKIDWAKLAEVMGFVVTGTVNIGVLNNLIAGQNYALTSAQAQAAQNYLLETFSELSTGSLVVGNGKIYTLAELESAVFKPSYYLSATEGGSSPGTTYTNYFSHLYFVNLNPVYSVPPVLNYSFGVDGSGGSAVKYSLRVFAMYHNGTAYTDYSSYGSYINSWNAKHSIGTYTQSAAMNVTEKFKFINGNINISISGQFTDALTEMVDYANICADTFRVTDWPRDGLADILVSTDLPVLTSDGTIALPYDIPVSIPQAIPDGVSIPIPRTIDDIVDLTISNITEGEIAIPDVDNPDPPKLEVPDLKMPTSIINKFPFSIPFDIYNGAKLLVAPSRVPKWDIAIKIPISRVVSDRDFDFNFTVDLTPYDKLARLCRMIQVLIFTALLAKATSTLVKGAK